MRRAGRASTGRSVAIPVAASGDCDRRCRAAQHRRSRATGQMARDADSRRFFRCAETARAYPSRGPEAGGGRAKKMSMRLQDKTAVVTAAGAGIGRACALAFHAEGARVWATDIDSQALETLVFEAPGLETALLDVRDEVAVSRLFARIGRCDVLLNAVGVVHGGSVLESSLDDFATAWDVNVASMIRTMRGALPSMLSNGGGSIVNVASVASSITGVANRCAYGTTKAAVIGLTKAVAADF